MIHGSSWNKLWIIGLSRTGTMSLTKTINRHSRFGIEHYPALWKLESTYYEGNGAADIVVSAMFEKLDKKYPNLEVYSDSARQGVVVEVNREVHHYQRPHEKRVVEEEQRKTQLP